MPIFGASGDFRDFRYFLYRGVERERERKEETYIKDRERVTDVPNVTALGFETVSGIPFTHPRADVFGVRATVSDSLFIDGSAVRRGWLQVTIRPLGKTPILAARKHERSGVSPPMATTTVDTGILR